VNTLEEPSAVHGMAEQGHGMEQVHHEPPHSFDGDEQAVDINEFGATGRRFPVRMVVLVVAVALAVVVGLVLLAKHWIGSRVDSMNAPARKEQIVLPPQGKAHLPDENTPMDGAGLFGDAPESSQRASAQPAGQSGSGAVSVSAAGAGAGRGASVPGGRAEAGANGGGPGSPACQSTQLIDKASGQVVRDAQGQVVKVDCHGVLQHMTVPAVDPRSPQDRSTGTGAGATAWNLAPGAAGSVLPFDRYAGDSSLVSKKPSVLTSGLPGAIPPPPVSSAALIEAFKNAAAGQRAGDGGASPTTGLGGASTGLLGVGAPAGGQGASQGVAANAQGAIGALLTPTSTPRALAVRSIDENLTIPKGGAIDCVMTTRVVTEVSGFTSCMVTNDVYSANGRVLLIERMSEVQGEYAAAGQPGQRRVYVLWSRIRKPGGITVDLASPSTDPLGAAGIDGIVDNRWFERIGSAYMLSIFKDFVSAQASSNAGPSSGGSAAFQNTLSTSNSLAEKVLANSINIKPTIYAHQGDRVSIYVARDLDFSNVYAVRPSNVQ